MVGHRIIQEELQDLGQGVVALAGPGALVLSDGDRPRTAPRMRGTEGMSVSTRPIPVGEPFDLGECTVGLDRATGQAVFMNWTGGPPPRIDGYNVGAPLV